MKVLRGTRGSNYSKAAREIAEWAVVKGIDIRKIGDMEDPWVILNCIMEMTVREN